MMSLRTAMSYAPVSSVRSRRPRIVRISTGDGSAAFGLRQRAMDQGCSGAGALRGPHPAPGATVPRMRNATWPVAAGSLVVGFGVAQASGVRALGGVVLIAGAGWCALRWRRSAGPGRTAALLLVYVAAFAGSHVIAGAVGTWPAVLMAAGLTGLAAWALADTAVTQGATA